MTERRQWPVLRRLVDLSAWALSMFEEKRDGHRRLSMTRCVVAYLVVVVGQRIVFPMGWPDAFTVWSLAFAIGIAKALDRAPAEKVVEAVTGMFGKPGEGATIVADRVMSAPHEWARGTPDEGLL